MQSDIPKVLQPLAGRPMLAHVLDVAASLTPASTLVVYGHGGERVRELFDDGRLRWALQPQQLGTGDALQRAMPEIPDAHQVLVLYGDVPLLLADTLRGLLLNAYAFGFIGVIALYAAIASFVLGLCMLVLTLLGVRHYRQVDPDAEIQHKV